MHILMMLLVVLPVRNCVAAGPNIVFILADDLGWMDLGCQGSKYYLTPNIDRLAAEGMRFTQAYTCGPNCAPTRAALLTGQYGPRTGIYTVGSRDRFDTSHRPLVPVQNVTNLPLDRVTIANVLKDEGYATAMFGKWQLGEDPGYRPSQRGFDRAIVTEGRHFDFKTDPITSYPPGTYLADFLTDRTLSFITNHKSQPFFIYLAHFGVHAPYQAKPQLIKKFMTRPPEGGQRSPVYAAMIASVDQSVGRIVSELDELNLSQNTLVIFSSDNGGVGGYRALGLTNAGDITANAPLRGGKGMLYEGGVRVPFIARWPGQIPSGSICDAPIISVDLFPTLVELAEANLPVQPLDGVSISPLLKGAETLERDTLYWHFPEYSGTGHGQWLTTPVGAIRQGDYKLLQFFEHDRIELYNLVEDVGEKNNLAQVRPDVAEQLKASLVSWRESIEAPMPRHRSAQSAVRY